MRAPASLVLSIIIFSILPACKEETRSIEGSWVGEIKNGSPSLSGANARFGFSKDGDFFVVIPEQVAFGTLIRKRQEVFGSYINADGVLSLVNENKHEIKCHISAEVNSIKLADCELSGVFWRKTS